jgi:DHA2 family lincomycin resistance protein-like MFS transporter
VSINHAPPPAMSRQAVGMIAVAAAAAFLATFNETFLNVALTPIMDDFGVSVGTVQWLTTGYLLVAAVFVPVAIVLYRRYSTRPLFVVTVGFLVAGAIVGALAPNFEVLLFGRLLQAVGTGLLTPIGMNITLAVAPRHKLGLAMGVMAAMTTLGPSTAIVASGMLLTIAPWSTLMWVFGGLAALVMIAGALFLRNVADLSRPRLDIASFLLIALGLVGLLYGVSTVFEGSVLVATCAIAAGVAALIGFAVRQNRIENPLLDLRPFRNAGFVLGVAMTMLGLFFVFAMNVVIPIFLQTAKEMTPLGASLTLAPGILLTVALGPIAGRLFDRHGGRIMIPVGYLVMAVFVLLVGVVAGGPSVLLFGLLYVPAVLATAFIIGPAQTFALSRLDHETASHGVTVVSTSFQIAGCMGTSLGIGVYGTLDHFGVGAGQSVAEASLLGFRGSVLLVVLTSLIGVVLAVRAGRLVRRSGDYQSEREDDYATSAIE